MFTTAEDVFSTSSGISWSKSLNTISFNHLLNFLFYKTFNIENTSNNKFQKRVKYTSLEHDVAIDETDKFWEDSSDIEDLADWGENVLYPDWMLFERTIALAVIKRGETIGVFEGFGGSGTVGIRKCE